MDLLPSLIAIIATIICLKLFSHLPCLRYGVNQSNNRSRKTAPEASGSWPIIGHLHLLAGSQVPHKLLGSMANKFGPVFTIKLGVHQALIVCNSEMAKECLTTNDRIFASRPRAMATELMGYNYANFALTPYGPLWREMRKIIVLKLGSQSRRQILAHIRASELKSSMTNMYKTWVRFKGSSEKVKIDMKEWFGNLIMNMELRMIFGNRFSPDAQNEEVQFKKAIRRFQELLGAFVPSDAIPWLRWLDLGGYEKEMKKTAKEMDSTVDVWLEDYKKKMDSTWNTNEIEEESFMAAILSHVKTELNEDVFGFNADAIVKATCLAIFAAATDTTMATLTWALALLANNPRVLKEAQKELEKKVGKDRKVEELDLKNLVYIQAIIKETLRLYPPAPLSVPHESIEDCVVGGYKIPKGTRLLVNIWKIQHDPQIWADPFEFRPERFLASEKEIDVKGQHFELIPFGSGRRMCLGMSFALEALELILASILHGFDFENPSKEQIDMTESAGLVNPKATPLELLFAPRLSPDLY